MFSSPDSMHLLESFIDQTHRHLAALATQLDRSPEAIDDVLQSLKTKVSAVLHDHLKSWEEDLQKLTEKLNLARENCMELMSCLGDDVSLCYNSHQVCVAADLACDKLPHMNLVDTVRPLAGCALGENVIRPPGGEMSVPYLHHYAS